MENTLAIGTCQAGQTDILKMVLDRGVDVNSRGPGTFTLVMRAISNNRIDVVKLLIEYGADLNLRETIVSVIVMTFSIYFHEYAFTCNRTAARLS